MLVPSVHSSVMTHDLSKLLSAIYMRVMHHAGVACQSFYDDADDNDGDESSKSNNKPVGLVLGLTTYS